MPAASTPQAPPSARSLVMLAILAAVMGLGAPGCSANGAHVQRVTPPLPGTDACVFTSNVSDWRVVDATTMIVYAPLPKDAYLLKLFAPVPELDFKNRVGFDDSDHNGQLCGNGDYLLVGGEVPPRRVPIVAFRKLTPGEAKQLLADSKPAAAKPPPAQPTTGEH